MDTGLPTLTLSSCSELAAPVALYSPKCSWKDIRDQVHLSRGTCRADAADIKAIDLGVPPYVRDACVPRPDWRIATDEEASLLWSGTPAPAHCTVGIIRLLGPQLTRLFDKRDDIFGSDDDSETLKHPLVKLLLEALSKMGIPAKQVFSARMGRDYPRLVTMTRAVNEDARIGLHFDRWDGLSVDELEFGSNRVSINLGPSDRYFIYLNRTASDMADILDRANMPCRRDVHAIGPAFVSAFPDYPVVRLRLRPGEAYIAPTENILHDGSSAEVTGINHYLSLRGHFEFSQG